MRVENEFDEKKRFSINSRVNVLGFKFFNEKNEFLYSLGFPSILFSLANFSQNLVKM